MTNKLNIIDCGIADYLQVLEKQHELRDMRLAEKISDTVLIVEHKPVITLGARQSANKLSVSEQAIKEAGIDLVRIRRGGGVTAHNPGQLVFYPIINIKAREIGISEYVRTLESIGIELLSKFGVTSQRKKGFPGLWIDQRKISSIGVRVSKGITYHGMAVNICNDLSIFDNMIPCGLDDVEMTSLQKETGGEISIDKVKKQLVVILHNIFVTK